jgi:hypothetical protein
MDVSNTQIEAISSNLLELHTLLKLLPARQRRVHSSRWDTEKASVNG